jgi:uroporphyrinogen-III synthase
MSADPRRPLVVTTRHESAGGPTATLMAAHGVALWSLPTTACVLSAPGLARAARAIAGADLDWIAVTSPRAAGVLGTLEEAVLRCRAVDRPRIAAVGPATAAELCRRGLPVDLVGGGGTGADLARAILDRLGDRPRARILWPRATAGLPDLGTHLRAARVTVVDPPVYATVPVRPSSMDEFLDRLRAGRIDAVCFYAPSAIDSLARAMAPERCDLLERARLASFGPSTAAALRARGLTVGVSGRVPDPIAFGRAVLDALGTRVGAESCG